MESITTSWIARIRMCSKRFKDTEVLEAALIENIQREDLNVIEEANAYKGLIQLKNITNESLAKKVGKSSSHI